jgi:hypothetical protein
MQVKSFHISDILSITTGRLLSNRHMDGVYDILNFMTGESLFTHQLPRASITCQPFLVAQFPQLATDELRAEVAAMCDSLDSRDKDKCQTAIDIFLRGLAERFGEMHSVEMLPPGENGARDPIQEAVEMFGTENVKVISGN